MEDLRDWKNLVGGEHGGGDSSHLVVEFCRQHHFPSIEHLFAFRKPLPTFEWAEVVLVYLGMFRCIVMLSRIPEPGLHHAASASPDALSDTYATIGRLTEDALLLEERATETVRVARLLDREVADLRRLFDPIRALHHSRTWTGAAADASRRRLDDREDELAVSIRLIDRTIDDLHAQTATLRAEIDTTQTAVETAQRRAFELELELGRFDDVRI